MHTHTLSHSVTLSLLRRLTSIKQIRSKSRAAVTSCRRETVEGGGGGGGACSAEHSVSNNSDKNQ